MFCDEMYRVRFNHYRQNAYAIFLVYDEQIFDAERNFPMRLADELTRDRRTPVVISYDVPHIDRES